MVREHQIQLIIYLRTSQNSIMIPKYIQPRLILSILAAVIMSSACQGPENSTVTPTLTQTAQPLTFPSGDGGGVIVFASDRSGGRMDLYLINGDGSGLIQITQTRADELAPSWSPQGDKIAFIRVSGSNLNLYILELEDVLQPPTEDRSIRISSLTLNEAPPTWSSDGLLLVYSAFVEGNLDLVQIESDGQNEVYITNTNHDEQHPAISPDGKKIIYASNLNGSYDLYLTDFSPNTILDLSNAIQITDDPGDELFPSWSPGGDHIIYTSSKNGNKDLYLIDVYGYTQQQVTSGPADEWMASYSPSGNEFVFSYFNFGSNLNDLYINDFSPVSRPLIEDQFDNWWSDWMP
jgi:TolB protein